MSPLGPATRALLASVAVTASLLVPGGAVAQPVASDGARGALVGQTAGLSAGPSVEPAGDTVRARRVPRAAVRYEKQALRATDAERSARDLRRLRSHRCLVRAARAQAQAMAASGTIYHQPLGPVMSRCGMRMVGENVAVGFTSGRAVVGGWMDSPGHRDNLLRRSYRLVGIGAVKGGDGRWYSAQVLGRS
ncbi:CAP domain-containing protein [Nocardioides solisilvae]|uniref:CAP domain-containing protein n=1 Tax=Nocardioides solisilvae TaxID=1542435 RepID=UPI000D74E018|nr:CAP domain-containing protein [Nocardioides solisilvae]